MKPNNQRKPKRTTRGNAKPHNVKPNDRCDEDKTKKDDDRTSTLSSRGRDNNPNWYFTDAQLAEQVSRLSMRNFAGKRIDLGQAYCENPGVVTIEFNPAPGVQLTYEEGGQKSGANLAGFKLYTAIGALTGRTLPYAPQDMTTLILAFGEIISCIEWTRRVFGVAYTYSQRNRSYPAMVISAMGINADNFFANYSTYRNEFNKIITRVNQITVPKDIAYFDKCAALYEHIYLDSESPMAMTIVTNPSTTWRLDETFYSGGSILSTFDWTRTYNTASLRYRNMSGVLTDLNAMVDRLMNSSTFNIVYADLINFCMKNGKQVWVFDYLTDGYAVTPEYNVNFLLQMHNLTAIGQPIVATQIEQLASGDVITPYNDVYPNANYNALFYNPAWAAKVNDYLPHHLLVDFPMENPGVEDRIESLRFTSSTNGSITATTAGTNVVIDCVVPDHYVTHMVAFSNSTDGSHQVVFQSMESWISESSANKAKYADVMSKWDWSPLIYEYDSNDNVNGIVYGDLNYYTTVESDYLRDVVDFVGLALYELR